MGSRPAALPESVTEAQAEPERAPLLELRDVTRVYPNGTAALAGYLRDLGWPHGGAIDVVQGEDMGMRSRLRADIGPVAGSSIRVSGAARWMDDSE